MTKLAALQKVLQSDFLASVREVYEHVYETVDIQGSQVLNIFTRFLVDEILVTFFTWSLRCFSSSLYIVMFLIRMSVLRLQLKQLLLHLLLVKVMPIQELSNYLKPKKGLALTLWVDESRILQYIYRALYLVVWLIGTGA